MQANQIIPEDLLKRRKASLFVLCTIVSVSDTNTGINPSFMHIESTTILTEDFKCHKSASTNELSEIALTESPAKSSRFERDKFTGYLFEPFIDALTENRNI